MVQHHWLDFFLKSFEDGATRILQRYKGRTNALLGYHKRNPFGDPEKLKAARRIINCRGILERCARLRTSVRNNDPHRIVLDTAWIVSLSYNVGLSKNVEFELGKIRGRKANKKQPAFVLLAEYALKHSKIKTTRSMWIFLKTRLHEIKGYDLQYDEDANVITLYFPNGKSKDIGFRSFQRYISDLK